MRCALPRCEQRYSLGGPGFGFGSPVPSGTAATTSLRPTAACDGLLPIYVVMLPLAVVYTTPVVEDIFGSRSAARVLLYLHNYEDGYALGIAKTFGVPLTAIQRQLVKFETAGLLVSRLVGKTRVYSWNPRAVLVKPLREFLASALETLPQEEIQQFFRERRRPRRTGKPL